MGHRALARLPEDMHLRARGKPSCLGSSPLKVPHGDRQMPVEEAQVSSLSCCPGPIICLAHFPPAPPSPGFLMLCPRTPWLSSWTPLLLWLLLHHRLSLGAPCHLATGNRDSVRELGTCLDAATWIRVTRQGRWGQRERERETTDY